MELQDCIFFLWQKTARLATGLDELYCSVYGHDSSGHVSDLAEHPGQKDL